MPSTPSQLSDDLVERADGEFDRFRDLTDRLLKVPKKELDEARERERLAKG